MGSQSKSKREDIISPRLNFANPGELRDQEGRPIPIDKDFFLKKRINFQTIAIEVFMRKIRTKLTLAKSLLQPQNLSTTDVTLFE